MLTCDEYNHERLFTFGPTHTMKKLILSVFINLALISISQAANSLKIANLWIPEAPPSATVMAGYMEIYNPGTLNINITSVSSPAFKSIEMHLSKDDNGVAKMLEQDKLSIPAKGKLILKAGSYHLMLMQPLKRLTHGEQAQLTFTLSNGEEINIMAAVRKNTQKHHKIMKCGEGKCGGAM